MKKIILNKAKVSKNEYFFLNKCGVNSFEIEEGKEKFWVDFFKMDEGLYYQP